MKSSLLITIHQAYTHTWCYILQSGTFVLQISRFSMKCKILLIQNALHHWLLISKTITLPYYYLCNMFIVCIMHICVLAQNNLLLRVEKRIPQCNVPVLTLDLANVTIFFLVLRSFPCYVLIISMHYILCNYAVSSMLVVLAK